MKFKINKLLTRYFGLLLIVTGITVSCEDEDFRIIPEAEKEQTIISIEPALGDIGTSVVITGTNFNRVPLNNRVSFGDAQASVTRATETELTVIVPNGAITGPVSISKAQFTVEGPVFTVFPAPRIIELSATGAAVGETIIIKGQNFGATIAENIVKFNGVVAEITEASETELTVIVPDETITGPLTVEVLGQTGTVEVFTIAPVIASFSPTAGLPGTEVTITGTNFSNDIDNNNVTFNGALAIVTSARTTELVVVVPDDASTGLIAVEIEQLLAVSETDFAINSTTSVFAINDVNDDVEEAADGRMTLDSGDLELGEFDTFGTPDLGLQKIGLRFNNVTIPAGAVIVSASIQFVADQTAGSDPTEMIISGENVGNAAPYLEIINNLSDRVLTASNAVWNIPAWSGTETGPDQRTVDISSIIQEIIERGDWVDGNSMNFIFEATGVSASATTNNVGREAETYDDANPQEGAQLIITFID